MNYSLAVVTTLGSNALTPATNLAQILTETEAMVGQLFLVIFVVIYRRPDGDSLAPGGPAGPGEAPDDGSPRSDAVLTSPDPSG